MVEKIIVCRDEVLHYPGLDHTWVYVYFPKNSITKNPLFSSLLKMVLCRGISNIVGEKFDNLIIEEGYVSIKYDTDEIVEILKNACTWLINLNLTPKDPTGSKGAFFTENKSLFTSFFEETKKILEEKNYKYYYQSIDGMN